MNALRWSLLVALLTACSGPTGGKDDTDLTDTDVTAQVDAPRDLLAQPTSATSVRLTWTEDTQDVGEFRVEVGAGGAFSESARVSELAAELTGLAAGEDVFFRVRACVSAEGPCSPFSATASLTMPLGAVPAAPDELTAFAIDEHTVGLDWTDHADDETAQVIAWSADGGRTFTDYPEIAADVVSGDDVGLAPNTTYCYQIRARGPLGDSPPSNTACATTLALTAPHAPVDVFATLSGDTQILLTWTNPDANDGYKIYESVASGPYLFAGTVTPGNLPGAYVTGLTAGTAYSYKVVAFNGIGDSAQSAASAVVLTPVAPAPTATVFVDDAVYPIVSLTIDGVQQLPRAPLAVPPGGALSVALADGPHAWTAATGFWEGGARSTLYEYSGTFTQVTGQTGTVTVQDPQIAQLLTRFSTSASYTGEYWVGTSLNYKTLRFRSDGTYTYSDNGVVVGTGNVTLVSYPGSFLVTFQLSGAQTAQGILDERVGTFYMRNGPADWPTLYYSYRGP